MTTADALSPQEWWQQAKACADDWVASFPVRPRTRARSEAMGVIIDRAKQHPRAPEILKLIYDAGWHVS